MKTYQKLVDSVVMDHKNQLMAFDNALKMIGKGRSAYVFKVKEADIAIKVFFPAFSSVAKEEIAVYQTIGGIPYYPIIHETGANYIVMEYIHGHTMFECLSLGEVITHAHIQKVDHALTLTENRGLNPSDIHLRNIMITKDNEIKLIDVARYRQDKQCKQWDDLKKAYHRYYGKRYFLKKIPVVLLNVIAFLYKKSLIPTYRA